MAEETTALFAPFTIEQLASSRVARIAHTLAEPRHTAMEIVYVTATVRNDEN